MRKLVRAMIALCLWAAPARAAPLAVDDPAMLSEIERRGLSFGALVAGEASAGAGNAQLYRTPAYRSIADSLARDIETLRKSDPRTGTAILGVTIGATHRLFDARWLSSASARFELAGVVNRMDRAVFAPGTCGEIRLVYRLAYRKVEAAGPVYSRLPMTANVVFLLPGVGERCREIARAWIGELDAAAAASGLVAQGRLKSVEINLQSVRWPSTVRPDMAGYAEYFLRVFHREGDRFVAAALENTPDVPRIMGDAKLKQRLIDWLRSPENFEAVDEGIARLPEEFLARRAMSVALHGTHRLANAPFTQILEEGDLKGLPYDTARSARSPHGLLRRLNDLTCMGCHQGRTVAGFHFLGTDGKDTDAVNAIATGRSQHFNGDQPRREAYVAALVSGAMPAPARPLSVRSEGDGGGYGAHCGLGDPSFASWTCAEGFVCEAVTRDTTVSRTGVCQPVKPRAGSACRVATIVHDRNPHRDRMEDQQDRPCSEAGRCMSTYGGFPGGMCSVACEALRPGETCGAIAILDKFNACLAERKPFATCLGNNVRPAGLKACSATEPCRDDYICARTASGTGACIPPYFLFQLRVDGHPAP